MDEIKARARQALEDLILNARDAKTIDDEFFIDNYNKLLGAVDVYEAAFNEIVYFDLYGETATRYEEKGADND